jgi:hypothetical protein
VTNRTKATMQKRARERARQERQQEKAHRREEAKARRATVGPRSSDGDPDIAGIKPGPQPRPWDDEDVAEQAEEKEEGV